MTINVAFKIPDAVVFATDGLSSLIETDAATGAERFVANVPHAEKLVLLSDGAAQAPLLAMCNGMGSLGRGGIVTELREYDRRRPRRRDEPVLHYCQRLNQHLRDREAEVRQEQGRSPRPFHLIAGGFDPPGHDGAMPSLFEIKWAVAAELPREPSPVLQDVDEEGHVRHRFGAYWAGVTTAVSRFAEGYDPDLPHEAATLLAGSGSATAPPGVLEELIHEARQLGSPAPEPLRNDDAQRLARRYTRRILAALFRPEPAPLAQHFSLQSAVSYCAFLAHCAYARDNWSPARRDPPRVGAPLQVGCLTRDGQARVLCGVKLGVTFNEFAGGLP